MLFIEWEEPVPIDGHYDEREQVWVCDSSAPRVFASPKEDVTHRATFTRNYQDSDIETD